MATSGVDIGAFLTSFLGSATKGYGEQRKYEAEKKRLAAEALVKKQQQEREDERKQKEFELNIEKARLGSTTSIPDPSSPTGFKTVYSPGISEETVSTLRGNPYPASIAGTGSVLQRTAGGVAGATGRPMLPGVVETPAARNADVKFPPQDRVPKQVVKTIPKSKFLANPELYTGDETTRWSIVDDTKQTELTPTLKKKRIDLQSAVDTVNQLEEAYKALQKQGGTGLKMGTLKAYVGAASQQDPVATKYDALRDALTAFVGRNIGQDVGNFAEKEAKYYRKLLPAMYTGDEAALVRFEEMRRAFKDKLAQIDSQGGSGGSKKDSLGIR